MPDLLLICLYGLAGSGKSTAAAHLTAVLTERGYRVETLKIAAPLYELQGHIYRRAGAEIGAFEHDNELLRTLATQLRRINPGFLPGDFLQRVRAISVDIVVNDDMRDADPDYYALREAGFAFVRITCADEVRLQRMNARADRTIVADSDATWRYDLIEPDWVIDTTATDPGDLRHHVEIVADKWLTRQNV